MAIACDYHKQAIAAWKCSSKSMVAAPNVFFARITVRQSMRGFGIHAAGQPRYTSKFATKGCSSRDGCWVSTRGYCTSSSASHCKSVAVSVTSSIFIRAFFCLHQLFYLLSLHAVYSHNARIDIEGIGCIRPDRMVVRIELEIIHKLPSLEFAI